jgi:hypothetical protein
MTIRATRRTLVLGMACLATLALASVAMPRGALAEDRPFVRRAYLDAVEPVSAATSAAAAPGLPASLVIAPGRYAFRGKTYDLQKLGLYRFVCPYEENQQRIVYDAKSGDVEALLSGLAWVVSHGSSDNSKWGDALTQKAMTGKLFITCGNISQWALHVMGPYKIRARAADSLTLEEWNSYDNGHSMIEVYREDLKKWVLYDLDANACFLYKKAPLSLLEMSEHAAANDYEIKWLATDISLDISNFKSLKNGYDWGFSAEFSRSERGLREWYKRSLQVPVIGNCFCLHKPNDADRTRVAHYPGVKYTYLTKEEFLKKFY